MYIYLSLRKFYTQFIVVFAAKMIKRLEKPWHLTFIIFKDPHICKFNVECEQRFNIRQTSTNQHNLYSLGMNYRHTYTKEHDTFYLLMRLD